MYLDTPDTSSPLNRSASYSTSSSVIHLTLSHASPVTRQNTPLSPAGLLCSLPNCTLSPSTMGRKITCTPSRLALYLTPLSPSHAWQTRKNIIPLTSLYSLSLPSVITLPSVTLMLLSPPPYQDTCYISYQTHLYAASVTSLTCNYYLHLSCYLCSLSVTRYSCQSSMSDITLTVPAGYSMPLISCP